MRTLTSIAALVALAATSSTEEASACVRGRHRGGSQSCGCAYQRRVNLNPKVHLAYGDLPGELGYPVFLVNDDSQTEEATVVTQRYVGGRFQDSWPTQYTQLLAGERRPIGYTGSGNVTYQYVITSTKP